MSEDTQKAVGHVFRKVHDIPGAAGEAVPEVVDGGDLEASEKLQALPEWQKLTPLQRKIVSVKFQFPELTKAKIAEKVRCSPASVTNLFHSANFDRISDELAKAAKRELVTEAVDVMKKLLRSGVDTVRLRAAEAILKDAGLLREAEKTSTQNKNISVTWKGAAPKEVEGPGACGRVRCSAGPSCVGPH